MLNVEPKSEWRVKSTVRNMYWTGMILDQGRSAEVPFEMLEQLTGSPSGGGEETESIDIRYQASSWSLKTVPYFWWGGPGVWSRQQWLREKVDTVGFVRVIRIERVGYDPTF